MNDWSDAIEAIKASSPESSVYIGSDSIRHKDKKTGRWKATYATVVIVHFDSKHGAQPYSKTVTLDDYGTLKQRLLTEAHYAIEAALAIVDHIGNRRMEVHLDMNPNPKHKSNVAVKEACAWVMAATQHEAKIKPHSWAASHCADHMVRK
jgi:hypothetical protein